MELINQGIKDLAVHRNNYDREGPSPTVLRVLWWEFPPEHWDDLRDGCHMNFLRPPLEELQPNGEMDTEQLAVAVQFVDELIDLHVVGPPPRGVRIKALTPSSSYPRRVNLGNGG